MIAATRSSSDGKNRINESVSASITCRFSSPGRPKTTSTPSFRRHSTSKRAALFALSPGIDPAYPRCYGRLVSVDQRERAALVARRASLALVVAAMATLYGLVFE